MNESFKQWVAQNKRVSIMAIVTLTVFFVLSSVAGCDLQSMIKVKAPEDVRIAIDYEGDLYLSDADAAWDAWEGFVIRNTQALEKAYGEAFDRYYLIRDVSSMSISFAEAAAPGLPGGTILMSLLGLATGVFFKSPGTDRRTAKEKESSYNKGLERGRASAIELLGSISKSKDSE